MQLPQFIARMLGFADKMEASLKALEELTAAKAKITELEASLATATAKITELEAAATATKAESATAGQKIIDLTAELATEKKRANETLAAQGISPEQLPAAETSAGGEAGKGSAWDRYVGLLSDPKTQREASRFYAENADAIIKSRKS